MKVPGTSRNAQGRSRPPRSPCHIEASGLERQDREVDRVFVRRPSSLVLGVVECYCTDRYRGLLLKADSVNSRARVLIICSGDR